MSAATEVDWSRFTALETLGLDEIALTRGHGNCVAVISTRDRQGSVLTVLPDRRKAPVKAFLEAIPKALKKTITSVCTDMYEGYINAAYEALPGVTVGVARFPVAQHYREAADQLRKQELKRLREERSDEEYEPLKGLLWVFRKDWTALNDEQQSRLLPLFEHSPALQQAYCLRQVLTGLFNGAKTKEQAEAALKGWCEQVRASALSCFDGFLTTLENYWQEITHYFLERHTSGFVEGLNNKLNVRFVDPKPNPKQVWGKDPEPKRRNNLWLENLILV